MSLVETVLTLNGATDIKNPSDEQIEIELKNLSVENGDSFAILGFTDMTYIQASGDKNSDFDLEYQSGTVKEHFRAIEDNITLDQVVQAFKLYRDGITTWQSAFTFEKIAW